MTSDRAVSSQACLAIDGEKIKQFRESHGLTQLYVATSLGVTVDTISRWENGRSLNIKLENAEKLVEVLEVSIAEISKASNDPDPQSPSQTASSEEIPKGSVFRYKWPLLATILLVAGIVAGRVFVSPVLPEQEKLTAVRYLPVHTSPAQPFPVILKVYASKKKSLSFIVKEFLPPSCKVIASQPDFFENGGSGRTIRWLGNVSEEEDSYFAYLVRVQADAEEGSQLSFSGYITVNGTNEQQNSVQGDHQLTILNYHWADSNRDLRIDDSEILTIYNSFDIFEDIGVDIDEIHQIWASSGYRLNADSRKFEIVPWSH